MLNKCFLFSWLVLFSLIFIVTSDYSRVTHYTLNIMIIDFIQYILASDWGVISDERKLFQERNISKRNFSRVNGRGTKKACGTPK